MGLSRKPMRACLCIGTVLLVACAEATAPASLGHSATNTAARPGHAMLTGERARAAFEAYAAARAARGDSSALLSYRRFLASASLLAMTMADSVHGITDVGIQPYTGAAVALTQVTGYTHKSVSLTVQVSRDGQAFTWGPVSDAQYAYVAILPTSHPWECGAVISGAGTHSGWYVNSAGQPIGTVRRRGTSDQDRLDECTCEEGGGGNQTLRSLPDSTGDSAVAASGEMSSVCDDGSQPPPGGGGGGGGSGGSGGYYVTVTECWGYDVYTDNGEYAYSVVEGCSQYTYFVPNYE